jgi:hypothetical protein
MKNKQDITVLKESFRFCRDVMHRVPTGGLKARQSLAQGNALCHGRLSTSEALKGRNLFVRITPFQGLVNVMRSIRRALPCTVDYRAFSPFPFTRSYVLPFTRYKFFIPENKCTPPY